MNHVKAQNNFACQNSTQIFWPNTSGNYQLFITFFHFEKHRRIHVGRKNLASIDAVKYVASNIHNAFANLIPTKKRMQIVSEVKHVSKLSCRTLHYHPTLKFFLLFPVSRWKTPQVVNAQNVLGGLVKEILIQNMYF